MLTTLIQILINTEFPKIHYNATPVYDKVSRFHVSISKEKAKDER